MLKEKEDKIIDKLSNIEEILKMMLVNNLLDNDDIKKMEDEMLKEINKVLEPLGMKNARLNYIEKEYYIFTDIDDELLKNIKSKYNQAKQSLINGKLVLVFDKLHPKRKKAFEEAKISYCVRNSEIKIY